MVDTGGPGKKSFLQLKSLIKDNGYSFKDLDQIVLTHLHTDHSGGVAYIQEATDLPIYVHESARQQIEGGIKEYQRIESFFNLFVSRCGADPYLHQSKGKFDNREWRNVEYLKDGDCVYLGGEEFSVAYVPGHSQTDILLWDSKSGCAISGDHLLSFSVNAFIEPPIHEGEERPKPLLQYRESLNKTYHLALSTIYPGHGETFNNHQEIVGLRLKEQEDRCKQIYKILQTGEKSMYDICLQMYPKLKGHMVFLGLSQIQGHLDLMKLRQEVIVEEQDCKWIYRLS